MTFEIYYKYEEMKMKKYKKIIMLIILIAASLCSAMAVSAVTWEFGTSGQGVNKFVPRGFVIETDEGLRWLSSQFENSGDAITYTNQLNGITHIDAAKLDGSTYQLYAYFDRNPLDYRDYIVAYKDGVAIPGFSSYIGAAGRLDAADGMGSGSNWGVPIEGFTFEPGAKYEFAFLRGLTANNGITLVLSDDGKGYIQYPETAEEISKYESDKFSEYRFVTSYWQADDDDGDYHYEYNDVAMRFSVQTYADLTTWRTAAEEAQRFLDSVTPEQIDAGTYQQSNLENLSDLLVTQGNRAEQTVKKQLQNAAEQSMQEMVAELSAALEKAKSPNVNYSNISVLKSTLKDARDLYSMASANIGDGKGQYGAEAVDALRLEIESAETLTNRSSQTRVDNAVESLNQAMIVVRNSRTGVNVRQLYDPASGVRVIYEVGSIPNDTTLSVNTALDQISSYPAMKDYLEQNGADVEEIRMYDIKLISGGGAIQPTADVEIQIPVDSGIAGKAITIYAADDGTNPQRQSSLANNGYRIFDSKRVSIFSMVVFGADYGDQPIDEEEIDKKPSGNTEAEDPGSGTDGGEGSGTGNPASNESTGNGDGNNADSSQTRTVTTVEETSLDLGTEPDRVDEEFVETEGVGEAQQPLTDEPQKVDHDLLSSMNIPYDTLKRAMEPGGVIIIIASLLTAAAVGMTIYILATYLKRRSMHSI